MNLLEKNFQPSWNLSLQASRELKQSKNHPGQISEFLNHHVTPFNHIAKVFRATNGMHPLAQHHTKLHLCSSYQ